MKKGFTLLELIVVIVILGILATLGFTQYSTMVENGRAAEAKAIMGTILQAQRAYYLEKGVWANALSDIGVSVPDSCVSTNYFAYYLNGWDGLCVGARRCTSGGKIPNATREYRMYVRYDGSFHLARYFDNGSATDVAPFW
ncbi:MAG: prepilin-type N-terminal cleavage/methylation domain-containing protein [Candidatus Omnitrophica bacterium]|nr:prepilin-type N-terminal cleavage/methylation domain-containing protein [Candidatus Omnitrophota bacterium]